MAHLNPLTSSPEPSVFSDNIISISIPVRYGKESGNILSEVEVEETVEINKGAGEEKVFLVPDINETMEGIEEGMDDMIAEYAEKKKKNNAGAEKEKNLLDSVGQNNEEPGDGKEMEKDISSKGEASEGMGNRGEADQEKNPLGSEEVKFGEDAVKEKGVNESEDGKGNMEGEDKGMESGERKKKKVKASANIGMKNARKPEPSDGLSWLPEGWLVEHRPRPSGSRLIDRYYYSPDCQQFRSKNEVLYFLENGTKRSASKAVSKNKDTSNSSTGKEYLEDDVPTSKRNASKVVSKNKDMSNIIKGKEYPEDDMLASKRKKNAKRKALDFDINNPPEEVNWVNDPNHGVQLTPIVGSDHVSIESKTEWAEALISLKGGS